MCGHSFVGRTDKKFCSLKCKSVFNKKLKAANKPVTFWIDSMLHKNRSILLKLLDSKNYTRTHRLELDKEQFNWAYFTSVTKNIKGKYYYHIYDLRYMLFSDGGITIYRNIPLSEGSN